MTSKRKPKKDPPAPPFFVYLPEVEEAEERYYDGETNPIEEFVFKHSPPEGDQDEFREDLQEALDHAYVLGMGPKPSGRRES